MSGTVYQLEKQGYIEKITEIKGQAATKKKIIYSLADEISTDSDDIAAHVKNLRGVNKQKVFAFVAGKQPGFTG